MRKNNAGEFVVSEDDLIESVLQGKKVRGSLVVDSETTSLLNEYNHHAHVYGFEQLLFKEESPLTEEEYRQNCRNNWHMPTDYQNLDVEQHLTQLIKTQEERDRVNLELEMFRDREMYPVLRFMIYFVDHLRANKLVWGVGRGSSVASYVLFLIGVHKINSLKYELDITEFLK